MQQFSGRTWRGTCPWEQTKTLNLKTKESDRQADLKNEDDLDSTPFAQPADC